MMEKLGVPQTHLALKAMIKEVDEDGDDKISFREVRICTVYARADIVLKSASRGGTLGEGRVTSPGVKF